MTNQTKQPQEQEIKIVLTTGVVQDIDGLAEAVSMELQKAGIPMPKKMSLLEAVAQAKKYMRVSLVDGKTIIYIKEGFIHDYIQLYGAALFDLIPIFVNITNFLGKTEIATALFMRKWTR